MEWVRIVLNDGLRLIAAAVLAGAAIGVVLCLDRRAEALDRELAQELATHHFERSSWFAIQGWTRADDDPELRVRFRDEALWHARRARAFQRMSPAEVVAEAERDAEHDRLEGRLMDRVLTRRAARLAGASPTEGTGRDALAATP